VIRTIRDAVGGNYYDFRNKKQVFFVTKCYNDTPHLSLKLGKSIFTPRQVQMNPDLEGIFIRKNTELAEVVRAQQRRQGMYGYEKNNILLAALDLSRTPMKFMKRRRVFNVLVRFIRYEHGNVIYSVLNSPDIKEEEEKSEGEADVDDLSFDFSTKEISVPIYNTKYVSKNVRTIPQSYLKYFE
jgi:hypothetical protein